MKTPVEGAPWGAVATWLLSIASIAAPLSAQSQPQAAPSQPQAAAEAAYVIQNGDVLDIKFYYTPDLNQTVPVRPDGKISLPLVNEVQAAGATPAELTRVLGEKYAGHFTQPEVTVIVKEFAGRAVYVGGEVANPNVVPLRGRMTALQAIFTAGGFRPSARTSSILVISKGKDGLPEARKLDLKRAMSGKGPEQDVVLSAYDIVFVPKSAIGKINQFVNQYINSIIPSSLVFGGFSYVVYRGTQTTAIPIR